MGDLLCLLRSLYSQSYAAIAHTFVDSITAYQELQRKYERLLEKNYEQPAFFEETTRRLALLRSHRAIQQCG